MNEDIIQWEFSYLHEPNQRSTEICLPIILSSWIKKVFVSSILRFVWSSPSFSTWKGNLLWSFINYMNVPNLDLINEHNTFLKMKWKINITAALFKTVVEMLISLVYIFVCYVHVQFDENDHQKFMGKTCIRRDTGGGSHLVAQNKAIW